MYVCMYVCMYVVEYAEYSEEQYCRICMYPMWRVKSLCCHAVTSGLSVYPMYILLPRPITIISSNGVSIHVVFHLVMTITTTPALLLPTTETSSTGLAIEGACSISCVIVHPVVLLSVLDHHTRRPDAAGRVIGTLLGRRDGDKVSLNGFLHLC